MFAEACGKASEFSRPLVISTRRQDGTVVTECATFIVLNREGWVLTAGHTFDSFTKFQTDRKKAKEIEEINRDRVSRPGSPNLPVKQDPSLITHHSFWWGWDGVRMTKAHMYRAIDVAVVKLEPFNPDWVKCYPVLRDPAGLRPGTSLCRAGYAFMDLKSQWDDEKKSFRIPRIPPDLLFFNEGMYTRTVGRGKSAKDGLTVSFVETSTPGFKGQSGGPIFDTEGRLCAMQSRTDSFPLGFHPSIEYDGATAVEHQFVNLGVGLHVGTIRQILDKHEVRYDAEGDESGYRIVG